MTRLNTGSVALAVALALGGCGKIKPNEQRDPGTARAEAKRQKAACGSSVAYGRIKGIVFDQAIDRHAGDRANLDTLADYSTARMEDPVVEGWDPALDITRCKGRFILDLPPGAERGFGGERRLQTDIRYSAQAAADGAGFVYQLSGADPIVDRLAAFKLTSGAYRPPAAIDAGQAEPPIAVAEADVPMPTRPQVSAAPVAEPIEPEPREPAPVVEVADAPGEAGEATVRAFYAALGAGNGAAASARIIPEKRTRGAFSPAAMSRFYGGLREPIRLTAIAPLGGGAYRVRYRYSPGRSRCDGSAIVTLAARRDGDFIRSIRALNGC